MLSKRHQLSPLHPQQHDPFPHEWIMKNKVGMEATNV